jgi:hypothetical protein
MPTDPKDGDFVDERTPTDLVARTPNSAERVSLGTIESSLLATADAVRPLRERWDKATSVERRALAARVAQEARQLGDNAHDLARWMEEEAAGVG